jgi:hypothetical protein
MGKLHHIHKINTLWCIFPSIDCKLFCFFNSVCTDMERKLVTGLIKEEGRLVHVWEVGSPCCVTRFRDLKHFVEQIHHNGNAMSVT